MEAFLTISATLSFFLRLIIETKGFVMSAITSAGGGYFDLGLILGSALLVSIGVDHFFYFMGRAKSRDAFWKRPELIPIAEELEKEMEVSPLRVFMSHHFINGFTQKVPFISGTGNIKPLRFSWYNIVSSFIWFSTLVFSGVVVRAVIVHWAGSYGSFKMELMGGLLIAYILFLVAMAIKSVPFGSQKKKNTLYQVEKYAF